MPQKRSPEGMETGGSTYSKLRLQAELFKLSSRRWMLCVRNQTAPDQAAVHAETAIFEQSTAYAVAFLIYDWTRHTFCGRTHFTTL